MSRNATSWKLRFVPSVVGLALAALGAGCSGSGAVTVQEEPPPAVATGTVTVMWTVLGAASPDACDAVGASQLEFAVFDSSGFVAVDAFADCADFAMTVELPEGRYSADVTLVDDFDNAVSTTLTLEDLDVIMGTDVMSDIDFPSSSIL
jgi:hypothetical protein